MSYIKNRKTLILKSVNKREMYANRMQSIKNI